MSVNDQKSIAAPWISEAIRLLGLSEKPGAESEAAIKALFADAGHADIEDDETPWCAAFAGACLARANTQGTGSLRARSYLTWGKPISTDAIGAVAVFKRGPNTALGHVGFVVGNTNAFLLILGGNQANKVTIAPFPRADLLATRWPTAVLASPPPKSTPSSVSDKSQFDRALDHVLEMEGGFTDDPFDPGGPTKLGITLTEYAAAQGISAARLENSEVREDLMMRLRTLTPTDVAPLYMRNYWQPSNADDLPQALALFHFDASVNHGVRRAAQLLQQALRVEVDGDIGPITLSAAKSADQDQLLQRYADVRRTRYRQLPHFWRFGRGWLNRVDRTLKAARQERQLNPAKKTQPMRELSENPSSTEIPEISTAPESTDAKWWGHSMTIWGTILTGLSTVLPVVGPLFGFELSPDVIQKLGAELTRALQAIGGVLGILLTIAGRARATEPLARRQMQIRL